MFVRPRQPKRSGAIRVDARTLTFFAVLLALIGLGGWLYLQQASEVASLAHSIRVLERDKEQLHLEIVALRGEVAMLGSVGRVLEVGTQLGYALPDTSDQERRLRVVYEPPPEPGEATATPVVEGSVSEAAVEAAEDRAHGWIQRLVEQLRVWIETPVDDGRPAPSPQSTSRP